MGRIIVDKFLCMFCILEPVNFMKTLKMDDAQHKEKQKIYVTVYFQFHLFTFFSPGSCLWNSEIRHWNSSYVCDEARADHEIRHSCCHGWYSGYLRISRSCCHS